MIERIFGIPIYKAQFIRDFNKEEIDSYSSILSDNRKNSRNLISERDDVLDYYSSFSEIKEFIQAHINQYTYQAYGRGRKQDVYLTTSWLNLTKPGMSHHHHTHPNSLVSGVFYFECIPNDSLVCSSKESSMPIIFNPKNLFEDTIGIPVVSKDLIIFPSNLRHEVYENKSDQNRISLSFNTFFKGEIFNNNPGSKYDISKLSI